MIRNVGYVFIAYSVVLLGSACSSEPWNSPYPAADKHKNIYYSSFDERPKHMDPARSYAANEYRIIGQIYEPPLQYHYLKRPYQLIPLTATQIPKPVYTNPHGDILADDTPSDSIAFSLYTISINPGINYQPHPSLAQNDNGRFIYHELDEADLQNIREISDFTHMGTRELTAQDYVYQIKRLAHPKLNSPIFGFMAEYISGLREYAKFLQTEYATLQNQHGENVFLDLRKYPFEGAKVIDKYNYQIKVIGKYPQFLYWLAMSFFAPMPYEADIFYSQPGMEQRNISSDWYPIGTGPYMLTKNNPNLQMVLEKNPNFHGEAYPEEGEPKDELNGLLMDAGKPLPFIDKAIFSVEKEAIPSWNKFLQGYYDASGINSESFDQVVNFSGGEVSLSKDMKNKGIRLLTAIGASTYFMGFNMRDPVIGSLSTQAKKLRQAISIMFDYEEYISIFLNGRGVSAQGPIPPGIFGYNQGKTGFNNVIYQWEGNQAKRRSLDEAKKLLDEAGFPNGRDRQTGRPLILHFDTPAGGPGAKARLDWYRKQFKKLNIQLDVRSTDYNRFQDKMRKGTTQIFQWGWNADYPDPENFLFLLYGPNSKMTSNGENASNYSNQEFDHLFEQMRNMENSPERMQIIDKMVTIARHDAPWIWGLNPKRYSLYHQWYKNAKPHQIAENTLKYKRIDAQLRSDLRSQWNQPIAWPIYIVLLIGVLTAIPATIAYSKKIHATVRAEC